MKLNSVNIAHTGTLLERALSVPLGEWGRLYFESLLAQEQA